MFQWIKNTYSRAFKHGEHAVPAYTLSAWGGGDQNKAKTKRLVERFTGWVYTCVSKNASVVASLPLKAFGNDVELPDSHPLVKLLDTPNSLETMFDVIEFTQMALDLTGNAYLLMERDVLGTPFRLYTLLPQWITIVAEDGEITGYLYGSPAAKSKILLKATEIIHIKMPNPESIIYGKSPLSAAMLVSDKLVLMNEQQLSFYRNNARPDILIETPFGPDSPEYVRFMETFREKFSRQAGKPLMSPPGIKITPIGYPPKDMAEFEIGKMSRQELCSVFGIPMSLMEVTKSRAEAEAGLYQYAVHAIKPRCERIVRALNKQLSFIYDPRIKLQFDDPVPRDREMRMKEIESHLKSGYTTIDEEREMDGLPPLPKAEKPEPPPVVAGEEDENATETDV